MPHILVIDDERAIRNTLKDILEYENYTVTLAEDGEQAIKLCKEETFDLALCDIKMPKKDGIEVLNEISANYPDITVVMISGHGDIETAVDAIKRGAYDFIAKPIDLNRLLITVKNGLEKGDLVQETKVLKKKVSSKYQMIGQSAGIEQVKTMIERVASTDARVMITGSNGTGKEVVARQIHEKSLRNKEPFIEVNCAAIPSELIESELFGHEKGAFTSAIKQRKGKFEQANKGTIFLDEIGDMSLSAQAKVLRALQENVIVRVGSDKVIKVDVRVIAATNKDLKKEIEEGRFREDLFHRLNVIPIKVPALNDRRDDIPLLVEHFNQLIAYEQGISPKVFTEEAVQRLKSLDWTGNIRQLRNVVERLIILCSKDIDKSDVEMYA